MVTRTRIRVETMTCGRMRRQGYLLHHITIAEHHYTFSAERTAMDISSADRTFLFLYYIAPLLFDALIFIITFQSTSAFVPGV